MERSQLAAVSCDDRELEGNGAGDGVVGQALRGYWPTNVVPPMPGSAAVKVSPVTVTGALLSCGV
jgi:hypothetical protein